MANRLKRFIAAMLAAATLGNSAPALAYGMERGGSAFHNEYGSGAEETGITEDGFAYSASDTAVTITGYTGEGGIITVPSEIGGLPVTAIGNAAFDGCAAITKITLPDSIESIDDFAFRRCTSLESINYPMSLREVSDQYSGLGGIFEGCEMLKSITVPEGITAIPDYAFKSCEYLENVTLPSTLKSIGTDAFTGCTSLKAVDLPEGLSAIGQECFSDCVSLTEVNIPDGVSVIEYGTFQNCVLLAEVRIPDSVTSIGGSAFDGCAAITKITLPDSIESIDNFAFRRCVNLESINYPMSLREVSDQYSGHGGIFEGCPKLKSITIPEGITAIPDYAFKSCEYIENITLPSTLKSIGTDAFSGCTSLKAVDLPEGLETIMYDAFEDCVSLRSVYIPATVKTMGFYVFGGCTGLTSVNYPEGLEELLGVGGRMFDGCTGLKTMTVPEGITKIFPGFFAGSCFESIILPESLESIGEQAFSECESLIGLAVPAGVTEIGYEAFLDSPNLTVYTQHDSMATVHCIENDVPFAVTGNDSSFEGELLSHPGCSLTIEPSANGYAEMKVNIEADEAHWQETYYHTVTVLLPNDCPLIESTLTIDDEICYDYEYDPELRLLTVDITDSTSLLSFALDVKQQGVMGTCASMSFYDPNKGSGEQWREEIVGVACGDLELFSFRCDEMTSGDTLEVWGTAPAGSEVSLYIEGGDEPDCIAVANRAGAYRAGLPIDTTLGERIIKVRAEYTDDEVHTAERKVTWLEASPEITEVMFYQTKDSEPIDIKALADSGLRPVIRHESDSEGPMFIVTAENVHMIDRLFVTNTVNNIKYSLEAEYDEAQGAFVAHGQFGEYDYGELGVEYTLKHEDIVPGETEIDWESYIEPELMENAVVTPVEGKDNAAVVDISPVTGDSGDQVELECREMDDEEAHILYNELIIEGKLGWQLHIIPGPDGTEYVVMLDYTDADAITAAMGAISGTAETGFQIAEKFYEYKISKLPDEAIGTAQYTELWDIAEKMGGYALAAGIIYDTYGIISDTESLKQDIWRSATIKDKAAALEKAEDLAADRMAFMLMTTLLPIVISGGVMTVPTLVLSGMIGGMVLISDSIYDMRAGGILGMSYRPRMKYDPSGNVYDAETLMPLEGVTATAYWIEFDELSEDYTRESFFAEAPSEEEYGIMWDNASEWDEVNPAVTGNDGWYAWDVPEGWWRVRYEKEGYRTAWSEWLPVLPVQTGVDAYLEPLHSYTVEIAGYGEFGFAFTEGESEAMCMVAAYSGEDKMLDCASQLLMLNAEPQVISLEAEGAAYFEAFVLDKESLAPLRSVWRANVN